MKQLLISLSILLFVACERGEAGPCGPEIIFLQAGENYPEGDDFNLVSVEADRNCLTVEIGASGCSEVGWSMELYTSGIATTAIPSSTAALLVFNDGVPDSSSNCLAYYTARYSFAVSDRLPVPTYLYLGGADTTLFIE